MSLAQEIVAGFHGAAAAEKAAAEFQRVFRDREAPGDVPIFKVPPATYKLLALLTKAGLANSRSEAERLVRGRAVEVDGQIVEAMNQTHILHAGENLLLRAGKKKFLRMPIFPQAARFYASEWKRLLLNGDLQSTMRLSLLPGLAAAAALELKITGSDKGIW